MFNRLNELIKEFSGNVLVIGLDDKLLSYFDKNSKINLYSISKDTKSFSPIKKSNKMKNNKGKTVNIKKLKKYINKKSIDYMIINMDEVFEYYKYIIRDSILLNNNMIYIYGSESIDDDFIKKLYSRYDTDINITKYKNSFLITIKNNDNRRHYIKNKLYFIKDTLHNISEFIGNVLVS